MNSKFKFDHTQEELAPAIGYEGIINEDLQKSTENVVAELKDGQAVSSSIIVELVEKHFTDQQIIILAAMAVKDVILESMNSQENQLLLMLKSMGLPEDEIKEILDSED